MDLLQTGTFKSSLDLVQGLVRASNVTKENAPSHWITSYERIKENILNEKGQADLFSLDWYIGMMTCLNLNVMRVDIDLESHSINSSSSSSTPSQSDTSASTPGTTTTNSSTTLSGSALYLLTSLLNHSCEPNAKIDWQDPESNIIQIKTTRPIAKNEEVRISYIGGMKSLETNIDERRGYLQHHYGFLCQCPACTSVVL
jgi:SET and MYND domain-containing protein